MKPKLMMKIVTDVLMTILLLFLMAYSLVGEQAHEWIGIGIFVLFVLHHVLNRKWSGSICKGKYTPYRIVQTITVALIFATMLGSMVSGIILSDYVFSSLPIHGGSAWARTIHMLCGYWGFVLLSFHLGLHWNVMTSMAKRMVKKESAVRTWLLRFGALLIAGYGVYAFIRRDIGSYMLLKFYYVNFEGPLYMFLLDYIAVMGLFILIGHYLAKYLKWKIGFENVKKC